MMVGVLLLRVAMESIFLLIVEIEVMNYSSYYLKS